MSRSSPSAAVGVPCVPLGTCVLDQPPDGACWVTGSGPVVLGGVANLVLDSQAVSPTQGPAGGPDLSLAAVSLYLIAFL